MEEKTAVEELQFIRKIIEESRRAVIYNGFDYIFWGVLVIVGMLSTYFLEIIHVYFNYALIWAVLIPFGWLVSIYNGIKTKSRQPHTFAHKILSYVWGATGVGMTLVGFIGPASGCISPLAISPILAIMVGGAYFLTGKIVDSKWTSNLAFGWWTGGIILLFIQSVAQLLVMALLMLLFQTIPGIIIYRKYKTEEPVKP